MGTWTLLRLDCRAWMVLVNMDRICLKLLGCGCFQQWWTRERVACAALRQRRVEVVDTPADDSDCLSHTTSDEHAYSTYWIPFKNALGPFLRSAIVRSICGKYCILLFFRVGQGIPFWLGFFTQYHINTIDIQSIRFVLDSNLILLRWEATPLSSVWVLEAVTRVAQPIGSDTCPTLPVNVPFHRGTQGRLWNTRPALSFGLPHRGIIRLTVQE